MDEAKQKMKNTRNENIVELNWSWYGENRRRETACLHWRHLLHTIELNDKVVGNKQGAKMPRLKLDFDGCSLKEPKCWNEMFPAGVAASFFVAVVYSVHVQNGFACRWNLSLLIISCAHKYPYTACKSLKYKETWPGLASAPTLCHFSLLWTFCSSFWCNCRWSIHPSVFVFHLLFSSSSLLSLPLLLFCSFHFNLFIGSLCWWTFVWCWFFSPIQK